MTKTATLIRHLEGWRGNARLYKLSVPLGGFAYVVVSTAYDPSRGMWETFIFPALADGEVVSYIELPGSYQGGREHGKALGGAGYDLICSDLN